MALSPNSSRDQVLNKYLKQQLVKIKDCEVKICRLQKQFYDMKQRC